MADALHLHVVPVLSGPVLVLAFDGWNDAGDSATTALRFIGDGLPMAPLAEIDPEEYYDFTVSRPTVRLGEDRVRQIEWPSFRFEYGSLQDRCDLILGIGGEPHLRWRSFCDDLLDLIDHLGVARVITLGAYLADVLYSRPVRVSGFAHPVETMDTLGIETSGYEGPTGIVGVLADRLRQRGIPVVSLWAGLPHYITVTPNPRGALALVQVLARTIDLPLDLAPLRDEAAEFEETIHQQVAANPALAEYVRELKKREFAQ